MRRSMGRTGGRLAVALSSRWALPSAASITLGIALLVSGRSSEADDEGLAEFLGGGLACVGAVLLAIAVFGIVLGRTYRGRDKARLWLAALFLTAAPVSAQFLWAVCLLVVLAIGARAGSDPA